MRKFIFAGGASVVLIGLVLGLVSAGPFRQRWSGGGCGPNGCDVAPGPEPERVAWEWKTCDLPNGDNRYMLWRNERLHGFWDARENTYRTHINGEEWGARVTSVPHPLPAWISSKQTKAQLKLPPLEPWQLNGVEPEKIQGKIFPHFSINGIEVTESVADQMLMEDDSGRPWLVINGNGREKVIKDLKADPSFAAMVKRMRIWSVPADHFSLLDRDTKKLMFANGGNPSITFMGADREILWEQDGYNGPADLEALRRADPEAPKPPPMPKKKDAAKADEKNQSSSPGSLLPLALGGAAVAGLGLFLFSRRVQE